MRRKKTVEECRHNFPAGTEFYSVATGTVSLIMKRSRNAADYISKLEGFKAVLPCYPRGTLWLFESNAAAIAAKNLMEAKGISCGNNITRFFIAPDGVLTFDPAQLME